MNAECGDERMAEQYSGFHNPHSTAVMGMIELQGPL